MLLTHLPVDKPTEETKTEAKTTSAKIILVCSLQFLMAF
jgi:hypothetical protein